MRKTITIIIILFSLSFFGQYLGILNQYMPQERAEKMLEVLYEEHEECSEVDVAIVLAIIGTESSFKNVIGDNGKAIGYMQLHKEAVWYVGNFYPEIKDFYAKLEKHSDLLKFPYMQIRIGYRYLCLLTKFSGGNVIKAIEKYNGSREYVYNVIKWLEFIISKEELK